ILIAGDEAQCTETLARVLSGAGYSNIRYIHDPREASALFSSFAPDLVFIDLHTPSIDGFTLLGIFNSLVDDMVFLPIVALTTDQSSETRKRALAAGAMDFLTKPFNEEEILLRTRNLLHSRYLFRVTQGHSAELDRRVSERTHELEHAEMEVIE